MFKLRQILYKVKPQEEDPYKNDLTATHTILIKNLTTTYKYILERAG